MRRYLACAGALTALASCATAAYAADSTDDSLTWFGITLYGTVDVGYTHQNRATPLNDYFPAGLQYLLQPSNNRSISPVSENGLSQSKTGLRGTHELFEGCSGIFKLETGINPLSGNLSDAYKALTQNNGVPLANRSTQGDPSRAGQPFQGAAHAGVSSPVFDTLTIGRQNGLLLDNLLNYDQLGGSYAFSLIGYSGAAAGSGDTQDTRLDNSVKYINQIGMFRVGAQVQPGAKTASGGNAVELNLGGDFLLGLSVDASSGRLDAYSLVADQKLNRHLDVYAGFMWSHVADGFAAGYLNSWTIDPTIGARFTF